MNLKCKLILEDYRKQKEHFVKLGDVVHTMLSDIAKELGLTVLAVEHRVKEEKSLAGKLERKGDLYNVFEDITDILGCRVICFLSDEVDKVGKKVEEKFVVDWQNSSNKKDLLKENAFGYLSLHYICSLPFGDKWPDEICGKKFEIQIRTILQHAWSAIHHDIGYKSDFGVPREINRQFARLAGLLELADDEFVRARDNMFAYTEDIRKRIILYVGIAVKPKNIILVKQGLFKFYTFFKTFNKKLFFTIFIVLCLPLNFKPRSCLSIHSTKHKIKCFLYSIGHIILLFIRLRL